MKIREKHKSLAPTASLPYCVPRASINSTNVNVTQMIIVFLANLISDSGALKPKFIDLVYAEKVVYACAGMHDIIGVWPCVWYVHTANYTRDRCNGGVCIPKGK